MPIFAVYDFSKNVPKSFDPTFSEFFLKVENGNRATTYYKAAMIAAKIKWREAQVKTAHPALKMYILSFNKRLLKN